MLVKLTPDLQRLQGHRIISIIILTEQNNLLKGFLANVVRIVPKCHDLKVLFNMKIKLKSQKLGFTIFCTLPMSQRRDFFLWLEA
jgi:hypothetical protein